MKEEKQAEESGQEQEQAVTTEDIIARAEKVVRRLEEANKESMEILKAHEKLAVEKMMAGEARAGVPQQKPPEESPQEYAKRVMRGELA